MKIFLAIVVTLVFVFVSSALGQTPEELIERGNQRIKSPATVFAGLKDLENAKSKYVELGQTFYESEDYEKTIEALSKALAIEIDFADAPKTEEVVVLAFAASQENMAAHSTRLLAYYFSEKYVEVIADATWLIEHNTTEMATILTFRGRAYLKLDDSAKAEKDFLRSAKLDPKSTSNYYNLGTIYSLQQKWQLAVSSFTKAILRDPKVEKYYKLRGDAFVELGQFQKAVQDLNRAIKLNPTYAAALVSRGKAYSGLSLTNKALADFKKALKLDPESEEAKTSIAELEKK